MTARRWSAALLLALATQAHAGDMRPGPRAIWIWEGESYALLEDDAAVRTALAFLQDKAIATAYVYADAYEGRNLIATRPARYRTLIRRMHTAGLKVQALLGSGYLHTERYLLPEHRRAAQAMLQRVLDYNAAAPGLPMGPAIPFWYDGIPIEWKGRRKPMNEHVQDVYDYVALMDYRDHAGGPDGIISHAEDELKYAEKIGKKVVIGIETTPNEIQKVSFNHLKEADMERELGLSAQTFQFSPAFTGFVLHHYAGYRKWLNQ